MEQDDYTISDKIRAFFEAPYNKALIVKYHLNENLFDVIGKNRSESVHTNFLKWFFSQKEWNEKALKYFLKLIIENVKNNELLYSGKEHLASIDWDKTEVKLSGNKPIQGEYPCFCKVNRHKQAVRVDIVMNLEIKTEERCHLIKIVLENKIDSPETNEQTWKYYVYFSNDDSECSDNTPHKASITAYKKGPKRYKPDNKEEILIFVLLSTNKEVVYKSSRGICNKYIRVSYSELYDGVFKEVYRNFSKEVDVRKRFFLEEYLRCLIALIRDK